MAEAASGASQQVRPAGDTHSPDPTIMYVIKQLESGIRSALDEVLRPTGVTALQYTALTALQQRPDMTQSDLARFSFIRPQSAADLVSALSRCGFISRRADPARKRRLVISLTPVGHAFLEGHEAKVAAIENLMLDGLDTSERSDLLAALRTCRKNIRSHSPQFRLS